MTSFLQLSSAKSIKPKRTSVKQRLKILYYSKYSYLLEEWYKDYESGRHKGPSSAEGGPDPEAVFVQNINGEHGSGPDADEEEAEGDGRGKGGDLGGAELADDKL